jgi:hypothetical protein
MIVTNIARVVTAEGCELSATIVFEKAHREAATIFYRFPGLPQEVVTLNSDPFVAATLLVAMLSGEDLRIEGPVSERLLARIHTIVDIYAAWVRGTQRVRVTADVAETPPPEARETGLFFSCGVDSFHLLLKNMAGGPGHAEAVSRLILVHGFDIALANRTLFDEAVKRARIVAEATGKQLLLLDTNLREFTSQFGTPWGYYSGAALVSVGLALSPLFRRCLIASSYAYQELIPWGSHPLLDPLWSTERTEFVHDGAEALRSEKIQMLKHSPLALANLRVCWLAHGKEFNCGECEKCLRTMIALHAAGVLDRCSAFARPLDVSRVRRMKLNGGASSTRFLEDLIGALGISPQDRALKAALKSVIRRARVRAAGAEMLRRQAARSRLVAATVPAIRRVTNWALR